MNPRVAGVLALVLASAGIVAWFALGDDLWLLRAILLLMIALVAGTLFDRARFAGASRTESTMGADGDVLIGFQARVVSVTPLQVEARGAVWSARLEGLSEVSRQALVEIVGREGFTLRVRPAAAPGARRET